MGMQSKDGGFAAFDADNDSTWLNHLPLADVEAVTDPSCPDLTGRVLEMMASVGYRAEHPVAKRAIEWLKRNQSPAGGWWGRWGINYIYGTFSALSGLRAIGVDINEPWIKRAVSGSSRSRIPTAAGARARCRTRIPRGTGAGTAQRRRRRGR